MKVWRPGITGKLFLAIFATCIVLLISMHWAVRVSFERGFIDYIKHGNEQRLQMLGDALGDQYQQHGNWRFLRNNDRFVFQILRSFEHDNDRDKPGPGMPPHGWRTQFWVVDQNGRVLVGPRGPVPHDGTRRPILVNGAEVGAIIASPVERLTRNTDINFDMQQRRASWMIVALSTLLAALATFLLARGLLAPVKRLVEGTHRLAAGDFTTRVTPTSADELGKLAQDFNQLASTLEKISRCAATLWRIFPTNCARRWRYCAANWKPFRMAFASSRQNRLPPYRRKSVRLPNWLTTCISFRCLTRARWLTKNDRRSCSPVGSRWRRVQRTLYQPGANATLRVAG